MPTLSSYALLLFFLPYQFTFKTMDRNRGGNRGNYKRGGYQQRRGWYSHGNNKNRYDNNRDAEASTSQRQVPEFFPDADCPYKGWKLYFPSEGKYSAESVSLNLISLFSMLNATRT